MGRCMEGSGNCWEMMSTVLWVLVEVEVTVMGRGEATRG